MPTPKQTIKTLLEKHNVRPSKRLGQNFLVDKSVLEKIIQAAELSADDIVLEVGPGLGILTIELAKRVKQVIAIEKDKRMCEILKELFDVRNVRNVQIINKDVLKFTDYELLVTNYKIIANLPYYITSPAIRKFLEIEHKPELMVLMVQKEVGQRITAKPPKMSLLSVAVQFYANAEIISYVSKKSFYPQPKVDSAILRIKPRINTNLETNNYKSFFELIKAGFASKRKFLANNLSKKFKIQNSKFKIMLEDLGLNPKSRAEELSIQDWLKLYEILKK